MHERITFRLPKERVEQIDQLIQDGTYPNRSEAIRDAIQEKVDTNSRPEYLSESQVNTPAQTND